MGRNHLMLGAVLSSGLLFTGCGGGGGKSSSCCSGTTKAEAKQLAVSTLRLTRATFAAAGFARRATRSAGVGMGNRFSVWLTAIRSGGGSRSAPAPVLDQDTGLYYTLITNPDGSGTQNLYVDSAGTKPAGQFVWTAPQWAGGVVNTYPVTIHTDWAITAGNFAGEHGTIDLTLTDSSGQNGSLHEVLTDAEGETCTSDFTIVSGVLKAKCHCTLPDATVFDVVCLTSAAQPDLITCTASYPDGSSDDVTLNPDGSDTQTLDNSDGTPVETGPVQSDGDATIDYSDGSSDDVNVDTGDDSGDDGGDDGGDDSDDSAVKRKKAASVAAPKSTAPTSRSYPVPTRPSR